MAEHQASRTLVKSAPELWSECSASASLARHLEWFGAIRITKLEPETAVAWEGDDVSGTVTLEPSGWGTRVILTVREASDEAHVHPAQAVPAAKGDSAEAGEGDSAEVLAPAAKEVEVAGPVGILRRLLRRLQRPGRHQPAPEAMMSGLGGAAQPVFELAPREPAAQPAPEIAAPAVAALAHALDSLGRAHHRPFSRA
jgi:hypothetical protein